MIKTHEQEQLQRQLNMLTKHYITEIIRKVFVGWYFLKEKYYLKLSPADYRDDSLLET